MEALPPTDERLRCPVCGQVSLSVPPYANYTGTVPEGAAPPYEDTLGRPSYEVCPVCEFEFGFEDNPGGTATAATFDEYRGEWQRNSG